VFPPVNEIMPPSNQNQTKQVPVTEIETKIKREREMEKALKDPTVRYFMDKFKAQILSIEPIKRTKDKE
ncbi:MAG: hypothetical protein ACE5GI_09705, partial [Candidatus Aminicenantales bacterium]